MKRSVPLVALAVLIPALLAWAQETPKDVVATYRSLADVILGAKQTEANFVRSMLSGHRHGADAYWRAGDYERVAAEMALFANEGDNAIGGVRKRLLEGGHHHNAEGEAKGIYEPGYVVVTKAAKQKILSASADLRRAGTDAERQKAWSDFVSSADALLASR